MVMPAPSSDRTRAALLVVAAVVAVLAVGGLVVLLLSGGGDDDRLVASSPTASPTPAPSTSPSPSPAPAATVPAEPDPWALHAAFVTTEAAAAAEEPGWVSSSGDPDPGPLLDPCRDGVFPLPEAVQDSDERGMASEREAGGSTLAQEVFRYRTEQDAAAALTEYRERVERCSTTPVETMPSDSEELAVLDEASRDDRLLVRNRYCNPACTDLYTTYAMVVQAGDGLSVLTYAVGEDGDPSQYAPRLLDAAVEALQRAVTG
jgi:hypothetical protein